MVARRPLVASALVTLAGLAGLAGCPSRGAGPDAPRSDGSGSGSGGLRVALVTNAAAATGAAAPAAGQSPADRFAAGDRTFGVFPIHDAAHCDATSWDATAAALGFEATLLARDVGLRGTTVTVGAMTDGVVGDLAPILAALRDAGGSDIDGHHLCIVPAAGVGVAVSTSNGFIAFEPAAIIAMNDLVPDAERTMYGGPVVFAHEFAHQIQFWYGNPFTGDKSMRRTELGADCMGAAFVAMTQPAGWITEQVEKGAVGALQAYADVKFRSVQHHGTRVDRARMAAAGVGLVTAGRAREETLDLAAIKVGCERAVTDWDASQVLTPPDQLWGGTEP